MRLSQLGLQWDVTSKHKVRWLFQGLQSPAGNKYSPRDVPLETLLVQPIPCKFLGNVCFPVAVKDR